MNLPHISLRIKSNIIRLMKEFMLSLALLLYAFLAFSQERIGLRTENYSGVNALMLNPAASITFPLSFDINLGAAGIYVDNSYTYIKEAGLFSLLQHSNDLAIDVITEDTGEITTQPPRFALDFSRRTGDKDFNVHSFVTGPSVMLKIGEVHTLGALTRYRIEGSGSNFPESLSYYTYVNQDFQENFTVSPFELSAMSWSEIGLNYGYRQETYDGLISIGFTAKYLQGYEAAYFKNNATIEYTKVDRDTVSSDMVQLDYAFTTSSLDASKFVQHKNGDGVAIDAGVSMTFGGYSDEGYQLRLGLSVLDIGRVDFYENAQRHILNESSEVAIDIGKYKNLSGSNSFEYLVNDFSEQVFGDSSATFQDRKMKVWLPAGISLQADYAITDYVYVHALLMQRLPIGEFGIRQENTLALTPRFEHRWGAFQLPVVLSNYQSVRVGAALRLGYLVVGTDNILSFFKQNEFYGTDLYVALKFNPFWDYLGGKGGFLRGRAGSDKVKCYTF